MDSLEKRFYTELVSESYKTTDANKIAKKITDTLNVRVSADEVRAILSEDYELEHRKMQYSIDMSYIF